MRGKVTAKTGTAKLGDKIASRIERHILQPMEKRAPAIVRAVRKCGGCTHAKHQLGSAEKHPDESAGGNIV